MTESEFYYGKSKGGTIYVEEKPAGESSLTEQSKKDWKDYGEFDTGQYNTPAQPRGFEIAFKDGTHLTLIDLCLLLYPWV